MNSSCHKTALLVGATGLVGSVLLEQMLSDDFYQEIIILTRKSLGIRHHKIQEHLIDFDNLDAYTHLIKADHIYCCLGTTIKKAKSKDNFYLVDYTYPTEIAKIAKFNGATLFSLISAMGACKYSTFYYNRVKGEVEETIEHLQFKSCNIIRPSLLLGERQEFRLGEEIGKAVAKGLDFMMVGGLKKYKPIEAKAVAVAMYAISKEMREGFHIFESSYLQEVFDEERFASYALSS